MENSTIRHILNKTRDEPLLKNYSQKTIKNYTLCIGAFLRAQTQLDQSPNDAHEKKFNAFSTAVITQSIVR